MTAFFVPLIIGSSVTPANPRIVALALPLTMITLTGPLLITGLFPHKIRFPLRVSSLPAFSPLPPLVYCIVEDVVAVDGGACTAFRQAWRVRYEESAVMRGVVRWTSVMWGATGCVVAGGLIAAAWLTTIDDAYGLCYGIPWAWALLMGVGTVAWVRTELARERREWRSGQGIENAVEPAVGRPVRVGRGRIRSIYCRLRRESMIGLFCLSGFRIESPIMRQSKKRGSRSM